MATPHPHQQLHPDQPPVVRSPIIRKTVARKPIVPVESNSEAAAPPQPPRPRPLSVASAPQPVFQQQGGIHPTTDPRFAQSAGLRQVPQAQTRQGEQGHPFPQQQQQYYAASQGQGHNASPFQSVLEQSRAMPAPHPQPTPTARTAQVRSAPPQTGTSNPRMQRIGSYESNTSTSSANVNRHSQIGNLAPASRAAAPSRTLSNPAETARRVSVQEPYYPGQVICTHCRKGIPPNVSTYICVVCSTVHAVVSFCVWCYTAGVADTSHGHHKSYYVSESDLKIALNDPTVPSQFWTVRRNIAGRVWYTHNATGLKTHIKPTKASLLESTGIPPGWEERRTPDGRTFFFHAPTGKSAWTKPSNSLPLGWKQLKTPDLVPYYVNEELGLSSWDRPGQQPKYRSKSTTYKLNGSSSTGNGGGDNFDGDSLIAATKAAARFTSKGVRSMLGNRRNIVAMGRVVNQASNLMSGDDNGSSQYDDGDYGGDSNEGDYQAEYEQDASSEFQQTDYQCQPAEYSAEQSYNYDESSLAGQEPLMDGTQEQPQTSQEPMYQQPPADQQFQSSTTIQYSDGFNPVQQDSLQLGMQDQYAQTFQVPTQTMEINSQLTLPDGQTIYSSQEFTVPDVEAMSSQQAYNVDMMQNLDLASTTTDSTEPFATPTTETEVNIISDGNATFIESRTDGNYGTAFLGDNSQATTIAGDQQAFPQDPMPSTNTSVPNENSFADPTQPISTQNTWQQQSMAPRPLQVQQTTITHSVSPAPSQAVGAVPYTPPKVDHLI